MPTYEYECKSCGHNFEAFQAITDDPIKTCPECGKNVRRLIFGGAGVIFKGSGFYVTDKNKGSSAPAGKKSKPEAKPDNSPTGNSSPTGSSSPAGDSGSQKSHEAASAGAEKKKTDAGAKAVPDSKTA